MLNITWYTRTCRCQKVHCPPAELAASHHPGGDNNFLCPTAPEVGCYLRGADKKGESCVCRGVGGGGVGQGRQFPDVERNFWQLRITTAELGLETYCVPSIFIKGNYVFLLLLCLVKKFGCFYQAVAKIKTGLSIPAQTPLVSPHWPCFLADFLGPPLSLGFLHLCPFSLGRLCLRLVLMCLLSPLVPSMFLPGPHWPLERCGWDLTGIFLPGDLSSPFPHTIRQVHFSRMTGQ